MDDRSGVEALAMSAGYAPLFDSLTTGTLCGRWPDIGLWPIILSMGGKRGVVDVTPDYIARVTGLPLEAVVACMKRFCEPDPYSRTSAEEGRRLVLVDPEHRDWGWRIVNQPLYRERARKMAFDAARGEDGRNAERMAARRSDGTREDPRRPDETREHPPSESDAEAKKNAGAAGCAVPETGPEQSAPGLDLRAWTRWIEYRIQIRKPLKPASIPAAQRKLAAFGTSQSEVVEHSIANGWQGLFPPNERRGRRHDGGLVV